MQNQDSENGKAQHSKAVGRKSEADYMRETPPITSARASMVWSDIHRINIALPAALPLDQANIDLQPRCFRGSARPGGVTTKMRRFDIDGFKPHFVESAAVKRFERSG